MAGLKIEEREGIWYAVGTFDGKRIRTSLKTRDKQRAEEARVRLEARLWKRLNHGEEAVRTFEEAALSYLKDGGEKRFTAPIIKHFKGRAIGSINPGEVRQMAIALYPKGSPRTRNRQAVAPARAIINHAHDLGWCGHIKVKQFEVAKSVKHKPVDRAWLDKFMAESDRRKLHHLSALVLFMNQTGTRVSEAIRVLGEHVDLNERIVMLEKTKTDEWVPRHLTVELVLRITGLDVGAKDRLFSYTDPKAVNRRMKAVCEDAGIEPRTTHSAGRHSFGTNAMDGGAKVKDAMEAGGWKSARLFMETYVHSTEGGKNVAAIFDRQTGPIDAEMAQPAKRTRRRFGNQKKK